MKKRIVAALLSFNGGFLDKIKREQAGKMPGDGLPRYTDVLSGSTMRVRRDTYRTLTRCSKSWTGKSSTEQLFSVTSRVCGFCRCASCR